ncbi:ABC transporter ATP-binding protein [Roseibium aggregatum]|uniref:ABC transporter ATP-binding protein n=1 Tax=Roseibium aggregatum TaxID=187304 RepID=A0A939EIK6_9HYPH|nr:ABC transporter ATP-binding protein [Roseibium aggregatum]MBN9673861.1 ABC transporter ATP-binding protein [Roseibium aggregatum]
MMELIRLTKAYKGVPAVRDVSLVVQEDEYLTLLGPSGSGKTTLLRLLSGLEKPDAGQIHLNGEDVTYRPPYLRGLGIVQQNYALFPHLSVEDNVAFGLRYRLIDPVTDDSEVKRRVAETLELVGLTGFGGRMVGQISGGQKQRVSLARTLVTRPKICLLDEPLGALDANLRERMTVELRKIRATLGVTFLHVTGNETEALAMGDRMVVLDKGGIVQADRPDAIFSAPSDVRVARFVNTYNVLTGSGQDSVFRTADQLVSLPEEAHGREVGFYAIRQDSVEIDAAGTVPEPGRTSLQATYITSEFLGSRFIYIFRLPDGGVFEVERHLSHSDPVTYKGGETCSLSWNLADALVFDPSGAALETNAFKGAA